METRNEAAWLMIIHQIPPQPAYLRVKIGRYLQRIGAVALKNTVYLLPNNKETREDVEWLLRETVSMGGEATIVEASLIGGLSDVEVERLFQESRGADYRFIEAEIQAIERRRAAASGDTSKRQFKAELKRLERRLEEVIAIDFFDAKERGRTTGQLDELRQRLKEEDASAVPSPPAEREQLIASLRGNLWVTRADVHVDRIASAWLIRRFIDPDAKFKFVKGKNCDAAQGEIRFDMFAGDFTHEGDRCTFEVLCERLALIAPGIQSIAELIHDIDLKDGKYDRPETAGLSAFMAGIASLIPDDETRLTRGAELLDALNAYFEGVKKQ